MAEPWNPNAPAVYGLETPLIRSGSVHLADYSAGICQAIKALVTEGTEFVTLPMPLGNVLVETNRVGPFAVDVYDADPLDLVAATRTVYAPNAFTDRVVFVTAAGATTNLHLSVDEGSDTPDHSDYVYAPTTAASRIDWQFGSAAFPASQRVYDVKVRARVRGGDIGFQFVNAGVAAGQKIKTGYTGVVGTTGFRTVELSFGERCPWTGEPWVSADVQALDAGTIELRMSREDNSTSFFAPTVAALDLVVLHGVEHRVARGIEDAMRGITGSETEFADVPLETPAGAVWSKVAGTTYYVVVRRARLEQNPYIVYEPVAPVSAFDVYWTDPPADAATSVTFPQSFTVTTGSGGRVQSKGPSSSRRYALFFNSFGTDLLDFTAYPTTDSQVYGTVAAADLDDGPVRQRFVGPATASYAAVRLALVPGPVGSAETMTIKVKNATTLVQLGSTITLDRETLTEQGTLLGSGDAGEVWQVQLVFSAAPAIVNGTAYYLELEGGDMLPVYADAPHAPGRAESDSNWPYYQNEQALSLGEHAGEVGFGSNETRLYLNVGTADEIQLAAGDLLFVLGQAPAALVGFAAATNEQLLTSVTPDTETCPSIDGMPLAQLSWTASALADADFLRYELQRYDLFSDTWTTIALLTSKSATTWFDPDARFGVTEGYRVRQVRTGEVPSDWSATVSVTLDAPGCGLFFTVAEEQELNAAYLDVYGGGPASREFDMLDSAVYVPMHGRDYQVAFRSLETRGITFTRTLLLNALSALAVPTVGTFDPLRELARANVSAVCVRDHEGNRWYMGLDVAGASIRQPGEFAYAQVVFTEVAGAPMPYEGRGQQLGGS